MNILLSFHLNFWATWQEQWKKNQQFLITGNEEEKQKAM
jgi:hypothetical protein